MGTKKNSVHSLTMADVQHERGYQKQVGVNVGFAASTRKKAPGKAGTRYYKNVGLGFKTPREAIEGNYVDKKCPFTGNVSIRGRFITGVVKTNKMKRSCIIRRDFLHFRPKYQRYEKRH